MIQIFRERLSGKVHATTPKGIVAGFEFAVLQTNLKEWHDSPWTHVCECWRKATKVGSTATVWWNNTNNKCCCCCYGTVYWPYPILPFGIVKCTFLPTTFLEIAVYGSKLAAIFLRFTCFPCSFCFVFHIELLNFTISVCKTPVCKFFTCSLVPFVHQLTVISVFV